MTEFSEEECYELFQMIDDATGGNACDVFAWDGTDDPEDTWVKAAVKLFKACGQNVPDNL